MNFTNKIDAIKALRALSDTVTYSVVQKEKNTFTVTHDHVGLRECKDFVEAVMAFGVQDSKNVKYCNNCKTELKPEHKYCSGCGRYDYHYTPNR